MINLELSQQAGESGFEDEAAIVLTALGTYLTTITGHRDGAGSDAERRMWTGIVERTETIMERLEGAMDAV